MNTISKLYLQAGRSSTSAKTLATLTNAACEKIRTRVAENRSTPPHLLQFLSKDESSDVRIAVASNSATPAIVLWSLASDYNPDVRLSMAENHNLPAAILTWLSGDENPYVAIRAEKTLATNGYKINDKGEIVMSATKIERTLRRMLSRKERLSKADAKRLRDLILEDGYFSRSERKVVRNAIENDLLDDPAFEVFLDLYLNDQLRPKDERTIA
ncbi:hypothetical protein KF707_20900 [Candidatus Obscuribacterales bacterium]|nr:hypothetical protein [Candidatus Obscuribacterales bacterium]MBX3138701.1 hypothetical protein [Candidatus Obscuribacterales bacterium]MBX3151443.1 hypothetical protein [Candidatus Obscuribacterales bacterium]